VKAQQRSKMARSLSQRAAREARDGVKANLPLGDGRFGQERVRGESRVSNSSVVPLMWEAFQIESSHPQLSSVGGDPKD